MKKVLMICLTVGIILSMSITAFATTGGFISSPSGNKAPVLVEGTNESDGCEAELVITAYGDRDELSVEAREKIEEAYSIIAGTENITTLNEAVEDVAKKMGVSTSALAVSDMFDISITDCAEHDTHGHFDITLESETLKNFVCLLHYHEGSWHIIDNAEVTEGNEHLVFSEDDFSPFAIVVYSDISDDGDNVQNDIGWIIAAAIAVLLAIGIILWFIITKSGKDKKEEKKEEI